MVSLYNIDNTDAGGELRDVARAFQAASTRVSSEFFPIKARPFCSLVPPLLDHQRAATQSSIADAAERDSAT